MTPQPTGHHRAPVRTAGATHAGAAPTHAGVTHENSRHTRHFTVIGNHLTQHAELSLLAIGLACHLQSLPAGARVDIKSLAARFPEGATRIASALRELETHGYLRRERLRAPSGRLVTRTVSCNRPRSRPGPPAPRPPAPRLPAPRPPSDERNFDRKCGPAPETHDTEPPVSHPLRITGRRPLPEVPRPLYSAPGLLRSASELLAGLQRQDPRLLLSACDTAHLVPGVATWLERQVAPEAVRHALTVGLPPEGPRRPAALLAHRLNVLLPPLPSLGGGSPGTGPSGPLAGPPPGRAVPSQRQLRNCEGCDRAFRSSHEQDLCAECRRARGSVPGRRGE